MGSYGDTLTLLERARQESRSNDEDTIKDGAYWDKFYRGGGPGDFRAYCSQLELDDPIVIGCWKYMNEGVTSGFTSPEDEVKYIKEDDIPAWLNGAPQTNGQPCGGLRLIHKFHALDSQEEPFKRQTFAAINKEFDLPDVFLNYVISRTAACGKFTAADSRSVVFVCRGTFTNRILSTVVRYDFERDLTVGYILSNYSAVIHYTLLKIPKQFRSFKHPLLIPFLVGEQMKDEASFKLMGVDMMIVAIEQGTGFNIYQSTDSDNGLQDYRNLPRDLGEAAVEFALWKSGILAIRALYEFLLRELKAARSWIPEDKWQDFAESTRILTERVEYSVSHTENLLFYRGIEMRLKAQQGVVFNLIAQEDNKTNIQLSDEMKRIAIKTKRDGSIMKTIAFLGAFFVPATFVSTLFAMPLFNWSAPTASEVFTDHFWIYGAVAGPLTVVTMAVVGYWILSRTQRNFEDKGYTSDELRPSRLDRLKEIFETSRRKPFKTEVSV